MALAVPDGSRPACAGSGSESTTAGACGGPSKVDLTEAPQPGYPDTRAGRGDRDPAADRRGAGRRWRLPAGAVRGAGRHRRVLLGIVATCRAIGVYLPRAFERLGTCRDVFAVPVEQVPSLKRTLR